MEALLSLGKRMGRGKGCGDKKTLYKVNQVLEIT